LILIPVIPGVRSLPIKFPIHRRIWRQYYEAEGIKRKR